MSYPLRSMEQIRGDILRDQANLDDSVDITSDSDNFVRATGVAGAVEGLYQFQAWQTRQIFPDTADSENLRRHAALRRIFPKPAAPAGGTVLLTGTVPSTADIGLQIVVGNQRYQTSTPATIGAGGTALVTAVALAAGSAGNLADNTPGQLSAAPSGISSQVTVVSMVGGRDAETDAELLSRLLDRMQHPPAGGNTQDYRSWAMEIPGITDAYVFPHRGGVGRVDVAVISGNAQANDDEIAAAQLNIDTERPAACRGVTVFTPTLKPVDFTYGVKLSGTDGDTLLASLYRDFGAYFDTLVPGAAMVKSKADAIVSNSRGVGDSIAASPAGNVIATVNATVVEWLRLGTISLYTLP
ncbi:phage FluMu protein gp47 [Cupriavidus basilensis OR16]|uniref:Phage FluMu protein gp47 n=1 Tax=Cupriavidus basilensis OR16 TaxID=1127483 RepID=H1SDI1_9BURK|nr:baseplate J/gp47 family protein [Cupriavidus basilensis]EHP39435.1 phage FluMu protein gp47 [Cupriavidus basilensis OR16]